MSEQPTNNNGDGRKDRTLSEISHLFLSSVRDRQTQGAPRPVRKAPAAPPANLSIDLTPEEFAQVYGDATGVPAGVPSGSGMSGSKETKPKISAIIGAHLNGKLFDRVKEYASHLCGKHARVGLIEVDVAELRLMLFERSIAQAIGPSNDGPPIQIRPEEFDLRRISEALEELSWDVEQWLLLLPNPRSAPSQALLREVDHWVLLSTCDHDGLVAGYRTLKGMTEVQDSKADLSLALLDAASDAQAQKVYEKLASVAQQFLSWPMTSESPVDRRADVSEHLVLLARAAGKDAATIQSQGLAAPQWQAVMNFLTRGKVSPPQAKPQPELASMPQPTPTSSPQFKPAPKQFVADVVVGERAARAGAGTLWPAGGGSETGAAQAESVVAPAMPMSLSQSDDVIDLPAGESSRAAIISAFMRSAAGHWLECPVKPPMCPDATVAVGRDRRLLIIAAAHEGLKDLRAIGRAYQWLSENRALVAMAVPQLSIDANQSPRLHLLVDQTDLSAEILQPMLQSSNVTVQAYRKLRWAGRMGLLLNAA